MCSSGRVDSGGNAVVSRHRSSTVNMEAVISIDGLEVPWYEQAETKPESKSNEIDVKRAYDQQV